MSRYQEIRDSKIDWIGKIPSHWNIDKIKYIFFQRKEKNNPIQTDNILSLTIQQGVIPISEKNSGGNKPKDDLSKYNLTYEGDIVMNSMNVIVGSVGISNYFGVVSPVYYVLRQINSEENIRYYHHLFRTKIFQKSLMGLGNGILIKKTESSGKLNTIRMRIPIDKLNQVIIPHPPSSEQTQIVFFLDIKTQKIDELIKKTEQKIKLLKEKRTSLINHCVTKGLNPNVEMKDSGVEWIGDIPCHWKVSKFKYDTLTPVQYGINISSDNYIDEGIRFIRITDINEDGTLNPNNGKYLIDDDVPEEFLLKKFDVLFCRSGHTVGKSYLHNVEGDHTSGGYLVRFNFGSYETSKFIFYLSKTHFYWDWIKLNTVVSTIENVNGDKYQNFVYPKPSLSEQNEIVEYLDEQTQKIDFTIEKETQRIELLKEYRQSLISEVVTGKVDVRDYNG